MTALISELEMRPLMTIQERFFSMMAARFTEKILERMGWKSGGIFFSSWAVVENISSCTTNTWRKSLLNYNNKQSHKG